MIANLFRTIRWTVSPQYRGTTIGESFSTLEKVFNLPILEGVAAGDSESTVFRYQEDNQVFYVKRYHGTKGLRSWLGRSRLRGEWNNLKLFRELDIPAAQLAAYGEERFLTYAGRGALITEALPNTSDLSDLAINKDSRFQNRNWVQKVITQVADSARKMHDDGFAHNDFKWRNILVNEDIENPGVFLIDCPAGQHWFGPFLRYRIIKDLACLDKMGKYHLSRTQRMHFFKLYRQTDKKLTSQDKEMIRRIVKFFEGRE